MSLTGLGVAAAIIDVYNNNAAVKPRCFFDLSVDKVSLGRVTFELYAQEQPKASWNFISLCKGDFENPKTGKKLHFKGSSLHSLLPERNLICGGDIFNSNGTRGLGVLGNPYWTEKRMVGFDRGEGTLAWLHWGPEMNQSQFFIALDKLDKDDFPTNLAFGHVVQGMDLLKQVVKHGHQVSGAPTKQVKIENCGRL